MSALAVRLARLAPPTDADLLARFVAGRDGEAFAELVRRHGPSVLAVCRRVTTHPQDAEDAFQAAFLVLVRKAQHVRPGEPLAAWLYGVAVRAARKAAVRTWRRRDRETLVAAVPDVPARPAEPFDPDVARVVVEEVERLSPRYRAAVVLCELEARPRAAAARELGIAEGTLSSRLAAARKTLAARLTARGLGPAVLAALAPAVVPPELTAATAALAGHPAPAAVAAVATGVLRAMLVRHLRPVALALVLSAAAAAGLLAAPPGPPAPAVPAVRVALVEAQPPAPKAAPRPLPKGPNQILLYKNHKLVLMDPDGKNEKPVAAGPSDGLLTLKAKLSPDGTRVAYLKLIGKPGDTPLEQGQRQKLYVQRVGGKEPPVDTGVECHAYVWSPDGSRLAACEPAGGGGDRPPEVSHSLVDATTGARTTLKLPSNHIVTGWLADGDRLLTTSMAGTERAPQMRLHLMNLDGTEYKALTDEKTLTGFGVPSPDGKRILCVEVMLQPGKDVPEPQRTLVLMEAATGKRTPVEGLPLNGELQGYCWSPDGTKIAHTWRQIHEGTTEERLRKETESHLVVADPDGRNARTILTEKAEGQWVITLGVPDWR